MLTHNAKFDFVKQKFSMHDKGLKSHIINEYRNKMY